MKLCISKCTKALNSNIILTNAHGGCNCECLTDWWTKGLIAASLCIFIYLDRYLYLYTFQIIKDNKSIFKYVTNKNCIKQRSSPSRLQALLKTPLQLEQQRKDSSWEGTFYIIFRPHFQRLNTVRKDRSPWSSQRQWRANPVATLPRTHSKLPNTHKGEFARMEFACGYFVTT